MDTPNYAETTARALLPTHVLALLEAEEAIVSLRHQPIVSLRSREIVGIEALARMHHPDGEMVPTEDWIGKAWGRDRLRPLDLWSMRVGARLSTELHDAGHDWFVSTNIAPHHLDADLLAAIDQIIDDVLDGDGTRLRLEVTSTLVEHDADVSAKVLSELRERGTRVWLDQFGVGADTLIRIREFAFSGVKIDRSFVSSLVDDSRSEAICHAVATLAHSLDMEVLAEGVETPEQEAVLDAMGYDLVQGYRYGAPMTLEDVTAGLTW